MALDRRSETQRIRPRYRDASTVETPHPGDDVAVVEPDHELGAHLNAPVQPLHDSHDVGCATSGRHELDRTDGAVVRLVDRLENEGVVAVAAGHAAHRTGRGKEPSSVLSPAEKRGKARTGVESGEAAPVDGSGTTHERRRLKVAEQRVVLDRRHPAQRRARAPRRRPHPRRSGSSRRPPASGRYVLQSPVALGGEAAVP